MKWRPLPPRMERRRIATGGDPSERTMHARVHTSQTYEPGRHERESTREMDTGGNPCLISAQSRIFA